MRITSDGIIGCIHKGIRRGIRAHEGDHRTRWIDKSGPEAYLVGGICRELGSLYRATLFRGETATPLPEHLIREMAIAAGAPPRPGPLPEVIRGDGRVDIALYDNQETPVCVIEVKRAWSNKQACLQDIRRVRILLQRYGEMRGGSLKYGFFAVLLIQSDMKGKIESIEEVLRKELGYNYKIYNNVIGSIERKRDGATCQISSLAVEIFVEQ